MGLVLGAALVLAAWLVPQAAASPSETGSGGVTVVANVPYGTRLGQPLLLDVYRPASTASGRAAMILIHGGGWSQGSKLDEAPEGMALARAGYVAFSVDYTLDSDRLPGFPMQVGEVQAALRWVEGHASTYGVDPRRLGVLGGSAGGYLAAMLATVGPGSPGFAPVRAAVTLSAPLDPQALAVSVRTGLRCALTGCDVTLDAELHLARFLGCPLRTCAASTLVAASPSDHVSAGTPPFFIYNSAQEVIPVTQATTMAAVLRRHGVPDQLMILPGSSHGPPSLADVEAPILAFLGRYLPPTVPARPQVLGLPPAVAVGLVVAVGVALVAVGLTWQRRRRGRIA